MRLFFLERKTFWDGLEFWGAIVTAAAAFIALIIPVRYKWIPGLSTFVSATLVTLAKRETTLIERYEKVERANREREEKEQRERETIQLRERYENQARQMIRCSLERLREEYFWREVGEEKYKHRVTLFVCIGADLDAECGKHLRIFARAGVHPDSTCRWAVDDNDLGKCRGIAAKIWFHGVSKFMTAACDWPTDSNSAQKLQYAESMDITLEEAEALNVKSVAFDGAPIMVRGQKWGVLLLDSLKIGQITEDRNKRRLMRQYTKLVSATLEGIES